MWRALLLTFLSLLFTATGVKAENYLLEARSGSISYRTAGGRFWDFFVVPAPEVYLKIRVYDANGEQVDYGETGYISTYTPNWRTDIANVQQGDRIKVEVWDKDLRYDDLIGKYDFYLTRQMIERGEVVMQFGQVEELRLRLRPES